MELMLEILIAILLIMLIGISALFSFSEMAITSTNKTRLKVIRDRKKSNKKIKKQAKRVLHFINNYNEHISSIVIFNNIVNIFTTTLATVYFSFIFPIYGSVVALIVMTPLLIVFGEIIPKQLAKKYPEIGTMKLSWSLRIVNIFMRPITFLLSKIIKEKEVALLNSDEEIHKALEETTKAGVTSRFEQSLIKRSLDLDETLIKNIMVPAKRVVTIPENISNLKLKKIIKNNNHTRFPIIDSNNKVISIFYARKYLVDDSKELYNFQNYVEKNKFNFTSFELDDNPFHIFEALRISREKMAIINNDEGIFSGMMTIEDIIELLFGEIYDENDFEKDGVYQLNEKSFIVSSDVKTSYLFKKYIPKISIPNEYNNINIKNFINKIYKKKIKIGEYTTYKNIIIWAKEDKYNNRKIIYEFDII